MTRYVNTNMSEELYTPSSGLTELGPLDGIASTLKMEAGCSSEQLSATYKPTWRQNGARYHSENLCHKILTT
jgi:hypothetical protein